MSDDPHRSAVEPPDDAAASPNRRRDRQAAVGLPTGDAEAAYTASERAQVRSVASAFLGLRPWIVSVGMVGTLTVCAVSPAVPRGQVVMLACGFALMLSFFAYEAWLVRSVVFTERQLARSLHLTQIGIACGCFATGALRSPLLPILVAPIGVALAAFGAQRRARHACALGAGLVIALGCAPLGFPWPRLPDLQARLLTGLSFLVCLALLYVAITSLTDAYSRNGRALDRQRRAAVEDATVRLRAVESVGAKVAHELKNPLAAIKGLVQLLQRTHTTAQPERIARRLDVLASEVERTEGVVADYLSFARPLQALNPAVVNPAQLAADLVELLAPTAEAQHVTLRVEHAPLPPDWHLRADPKLLQQALLNLLLNALDACAPGDAVTLCVTRQPDGGAHIDVRDTGSGMNAATLERLGTPLFTTRDTGSGLGVVLAQSIARQHGGALTYTSAPGRGTRARLALPPHPPAHALSPPLLVSPPLPSRGDTTP